MVATSQGAAETRRRRSHTIRLGGFNLHWQETNTALSFNFIMTYKHSEAKQDLANWAKRDQEVLHNQEHILALLQLQGG